MKNEDEMRREKKNKKSENVSIVSNRKDRKNEVGSFRMDEVVETTDDSFADRSIDRRRNAVEENE